ncbi:MAG: hypothetical protein ACRDQF_06040, partial [Thermocrispum sp.]
GDREVPLAEYFTGYRRSVRRAGELIRAVRVPLPHTTVTSPGDRPPKPPDGFAESVFAFHKAAKRRFDDISGVAVAFAVVLADGVVSSVRIGLGGVAATPIRATATEAALIGQPWTETTVERAAEVLSGEGTPMDDHRASAAYRVAMLGQSLRKVFADSTAGAAP